MSAQKRHSALERAQVGRPDWFADQTRTDEAYATPFIISQP